MVTWCVVCARPAPSPNRYVVLSNMLSLSQINPFDSQEAKVYVHASPLCLLHPKAAARLVW